MSQLAVHNDGHLGFGQFGEGPREALTRVARGTSPAQWGWTQWGETTMRRQAMIILAALATAAAGCHKDNGQNDALQQDLNLANQSTARTDSISAVERGYATPAPAATAPRTASRTSTSRSSTPARRSSSSSSSSGTASAPAPAPTTTVQKNTKRDAAIGAAAGAIIGAATSKDKVKGGIIGAAAGGILGGVIGNNVDVKKKKP